MVSKIMEKVMKILDLQKSTNPDLKTPTDNSQTRWLFINVFDLSEGSPKTNPYCGQIGVWTCEICSQISHPDHWPTLFQLSGIETLD